MLGRGWPEALIIAGSVPGVAQGMEMEESSPVLSSIERLVDLGKPNKGWEWERGEVLLPRKMLCSPCHKPAREQELRLPGAPRFPE